MLNAVQGRRWCKGGGGAGIVARDDDVPPPPRTPFDGPRACWPRRGRRCTCATFVSAAALAPPQSTKSRRVSSRRRLAAIGPGQGGGKKCLQAGAPSGPGRSQACRLRSLHLRYRNRPSPPPPLRPFHPSAARTACIHSCISFSVSAARTSGASPIACESTKVNGRPMLLSSRRRTCHRPYRTGGCGRQASADGMGRWRMRGRVGRRERVEKGQRGAWHEGRRGARNDVHNAMACDARPKRERHPCWACGLWRRSQCTRG